ncbi:putative coiled-coil domain-containing protein mtmr15 [Erysiphe necator]|uniref:Fanconi-associated nuclease n=1 Tax=Uncinula necator TaxID=52586 RepID=A0A0B1PGA6_UNCNE|nr:putative coiled-coil domain-containing protein mtmr15 [Erysiphe necator]
MGKHETINAVSSSTNIFPTTFFYNSNQLEKSASKIKSQYANTVNLTQPLSSSHRKNQNHTQATKRLKVNHSPKDENDVNVITTNSNEKNKAPNLFNLLPNQSGGKNDGEDRVLNKNPGMKNDDLGCELSIEEETVRETDLELALPMTISQVDAESVIKDYKIIQSLKNEPQEEKLGLSQTSIIDYSIHHDSDSFSDSRSSIYVDAFNLVLKTVLQDEGHLFNVKELEVFKNWRELDYEAQYLYTRLFLRKSSVWHRINSLKYYSDISDLSVAAKKLQSSRDFSMPYVQTELDTTMTDFTSEGEIIELGSSFTFADSSTDNITTLEEASSLLRLEELKIISKDAKVGGKNKSEILKALCKTSKCQSGLDWKKLKRPNSNSKLGNQSNPATSSSHEIDRIEDVRPDQIYFQKIMKIIGPCIRLSLPILKLFERVHLVFYRSTEWTEKSLITIILAQISRRNFPQYIISRSANIFASRSDLLEFEASLQMQFHVDQLLIEKTSNRSDQEVKFKKILDIVDQAYPRWKTLVQKEKRLDDSFKNNSTHRKSDSLLTEISGEGAYLRRFSPAWVYTRILHKGLYILGRLKQYEREYDLVTELLSQKFFHLARRGPWYQRKALLEEHYMYQFRRPPSKQQLINLPEQLEDKLLKKYWKQIALSTCEIALQDKDCHQIFHYDLQKRIYKLEKQIKIPKREKHDFAHVLLCKPTEVWIEGIQVVKECNKNITISGSKGSNSHLNDERNKGRSTKTIWINEVEGNVESGVEEMCLSVYRTRGYKGFHAEGGILLTLFAFLFYDILFLYVPNVFQTAYQTCPLDLFSDTFYQSRASEINHRLAAIENGAAAHFIQMVDEKERHKRTCVVGLNWEYATHDLLEVVTCLNPNALATICRVLAQEYRIRRGGLPDLLLWHMGKREVIFAEVKSANDRLSETQRLWIHILTSVGLKVELCHAVAKEFRSSTTTIT